MLSLFCSRAEERAHAGEGTVAATRAALLVSILLGGTGCNGIFWGNLGVLCVTVGIFLGTVFLSRSNNAARTASRSTPPTSSSSRAEPRASTTNS
jgi:hypothetical protein